MGFWDNEDYGFRGKKTARRRDVTKFGIAAPKLQGENGRLYIPERVRAKPGQYVRYVETPDGMAFRISDKGDYKIGVQNGGTGILMASAPYALCRFAPDKNAISIEVEDFNGGYLCRYSQFK